MAETIIAPVQEHMAAELGPITADMGVYGNVVMNGTFMVGATLVMMERFDPAVSLAEIQRHRATVFDGVPTMYAMMLADPSQPGADLSSLRICTVGGQTMPAAKMAEWELRSGVPLL